MENRASRPGRRANEIGPSGRQAASNLEQIREERRLSQRELAAKVTELGRPMTMQIVSKTEQCERRMDVDDLMVLSIALRVNPSALLLPRNVGTDDVIELAPHVQQRAAVAWMWADGRAPLPDELIGTGVTAIETPHDRFADFMKYSRPDGPFEADPAVQEGYNLTDGIDRVARSDIKTYAEWRDYIIRRYRLVGIYLEELLARRDREMIAATGEQQDTSAALAQIRDAADSVRRPDVDYAPGTPERIREGYRADAARLQDPPQRERLENEEGDDAR